jgi:BirA family transcriptional regulator, biotin operon repressor / biotin---[acetyl-CoA-carboxylase] ligase
MQLDSRAAAAGVRLFAHDVLDSTNAEGLRLARTGERAPFWITARSQTAGRGRRGRTWISEPGNLYASLLLYEPSPPECAAQLSFVAALAVHDAVGELIGLGAPLMLKWPNDLLYEGAKVAGILVEGEGSFVVVGIGVNCAHHPEHTRYPTTHLQACGAQASPEDLFARLSDWMMHRLAQWEHGAGFHIIRTEWLARAFGLGREIRVATAERDLPGVFESLDETGRLVLRRPDGQREAVTAGEVFPIAHRTAGNPPPPASISETSRLEASPSKEAMP